MSLLSTSKYSSDAVTPEPSMTTLFVLDVVALPQSCAPPVPESNVIWISFDEPVGVMSTTPSTVLSPVSCWIVTVCVAGLYVHPPGGDGGRGLRPYHGQGLEHTECSYRDQCGLHPGGVTTFPKEGHSTPPFLHSLQVHPEPGVATRRIVRGKSHGLYSSIRT